uniref:PGG domain-containing protein n=1 Tax=Panagrellus redivivus TaxID=6233 RepID=A0A7E4V7T9_PANRE
MSSLLSFLQRDCAVLWTNLDKAIATEDPHYGAKPLFKRVPNTLEKQERQKLGLALTPDAGRMGQPEVPRRPTATFCGGCLTAHSTLIALVAFDILLLSHSLIFTITNLPNGSEKYMASNPIVAKIIPYDYLLPLLIFQVIWVITAIMALVSIQVLIPYLQMPYLLFCAIVIIAIANLICFSALNMNPSMSKDIPKWAFILTLTLSSVYLVLQLIFFCCKCICLKMSLRKRNTVTSLERHSKMMISSIDATFDTYSTRSTVIVGDDYPPPPSP